LADDTELFEEGYDDDEREYDDEED
jgi:hypothetical protein